jgi:hypothetical protein
VNVRCQLRNGRLSVCGRTPTNGRTWPTTVFRAIDPVRVPESGRVTLPALSAIVTLLIRIPETLLQQGFVAFNACASAN